MEKKQVVVVSGACPVGLPKEGGLDSGKAVGSGLQRFRPLGPFQQLLRYQCESKAKRSSNLCGAGTFRAIRLKGPEHQGRARVRSQLAC